MLKLIIEDDEGRRKVVPFQRDEITIGRQEGNTIRLTERNISRQHARLIRHNGDVLLEDLGSYNGIRVNGQKIEKQIQIRTGDLVQIGDYGLALEASESRAAEILELGTPSKELTATASDLAMEPQRGAEAPQGRSQRKWLALVAALALVAGGAAKLGPIYLKRGLERVANLTQSLAEATVVVAPEPAPASAPGPAEGTPSSETSPRVGQGTSANPTEEENEPLLLPEQKREPEPSRFTRDSEPSRPLHKRMVAGTAPAEKTNTNLDRWPQADHAAARRYLEQGTAMLRSNQLREAEGSFSHCLDADPAYFHCYMFMGSTLAKLGRMDEAAKYYRMFVHMAPGDPLAPRIRGYIEGYESAKK